MQLSTYVLRDTKIKKKWTQKSRPLPAATLIWKMPSQNSLFRIFFVTYQLGPIFGYTLPTAPPKDRRCNDLRDRQISLAEEIGVSSITSCIKWNSEWKSNHQTFLWLVYSHVAIWHNLYRLCINIKHCQYKQEDSNKSCHLPTAADLFTFSGHAQ